MSRKLFQVALSCSCIHLQTVINITLSTDPRKQFSSFLFKKNTLSTSFEKMSYADMASRGRNQSRGAYNQSRGRGNGRGRGNQGTENNSGNKGHYNSGQCSGGQQRNQFQSSGSHQGNPNYSGSLQQSGHGGRGSGSHQGNSYHSGSGSHQENSYHSGSGQHSDHRGRGEQINQYPGSGSHQGNSNCCSSGQQSDPGDRKQHWNQTQSDNSFQRSTSHTSDPGSEGHTYKTQKSGDGGSYNKDRKCEDNKRRHDGSPDKDKSSGAHANKGRNATDHFADEKHKDGKGHGKQHNSHGGGGSSRKNIEKDKPQPLPAGSTPWMGVAITELNRAPECFNEKEKSLSRLESTLNHKVFREIPPNGWKNEMSSVLESKNDARDDDYVCLPNSIKSVVLESGTSYTRWDRIKKTLEKRIPGPFELEEAILSYNPYYRKKWNFEALHQYFEALSSSERDEFFEVILPEMQKLALKLPTLCPEALPILKSKRNMKLTLSQKQIACLLANAFFCTFPRRIGKSGRDLSDINFSNLYSESNYSRKIEKLKCIVNYFMRVTQNMPTGTVTYTRQHVPADRGFWFREEKKLTNLHVSTVGTIEDDGGGMLQADFANKYVGGGVLGNGLVQEEIRFVLCPEMIMSKLFTEVLTDTEVLIMTGCERFSNYTGYSDTFRFSGNHEDRTPSDNQRRKYTEVVAMDALVFRRDYYSQFEHDGLIRELNKAYCAFKCSESYDNLPAVCTGNWGCGAFGGDKDLKALIQLMAASAAGRDICYLTFGDHDLCKQFHAVHQALKEREYRIKNIMNLLMDYRSCREPISLFRFILDKIGSQRGSSGGGGYREDSSSWPKVGAD